MTMTTKDSTGKPVVVGTWVRHRGMPYKIKSFGEKTEGRGHTVHFENTDVVGDECSIDVLPANLIPKD